MRLTLGLPVRVSRRLHGLSLDRLRCRRIRLAPHAKGLVLSKRRNTVEAGTAFRIRSDHAADAMLAVNDKITYIELNAFAAIKLLFRCQRVHRFAERPQNDPRRGAFALGLQFAGRRRMRPPSV